MLLGPQSINKLVCSHKYVLLKQLSHYLSRLFYCKTNKPPSYTCVSLKSGSSNDTQVPVEASLKMEQYICNR